MSAYKRGHYLRDDARNPRHRREVHRYSPEWAALPDDDATFGTYDCDWQRLQEALHAYDADYIESALARPYRLYRFEDGTLSTTHSDGSVTAEVIVNPAADDPRTTSKILAGPPIMLTCYKCSTVLARLQFTHDFQNDPPEWPIVGYTLRAAEADGTISVAEHIAQSRVYHSSSEPVTTAAPGQPRFRGFGSPRSTWECPTADCSMTEIQSLHTTVMLCAAARKADVRALPVDWIRSGSITFDMFVQSFR